MFLRFFRWLESLFSPALDVVDLVEHTPCLAMAHALLLSVNFSHCVLPCNIFR